MKRFQPAKRAMLALAAAMLVSPAWGQGTAKPGVITVGLIPAEDARAMVRQSQAILDIVAKHTGMKVETFVGSDYNATIEALRSGTFVPAAVVDLSKAGVRPGRFEAAVAFWRLPEGVTVVGPRNRPITVQSVLRER